MATLDQATLKRIQDQARKQGISMDKINTVAQQKGITFSPVAPKITAPIDMNVGVRPTEISNESASLYGFGTRATPTVATPTNPLLIKQPGATNLEYDSANPQDFIYKLNARKAAGGKISEQDMYNYQIAIDAQKKATGSEDPYQARIKQQQDMISSQQAEQKTAMQTAKQQKQAELDAKYGILRDQTTEAGQRQAVAGQRATSFSGFGRSTFNADQQAQIGKQTGQALSQLENAKALELQARQAEQAGSDAEALAPLYKSIQSAKDASAKYQIDAITAANDANSKTRASFTQALQNLASVASASGLNMDEKGFAQAAQAYSGLKTDAEKQAFLGNYSEKEQMMLMGLSANQTTEAPEVKNIGTAKNPRWVQWNGKSRDPISAAQAANISRGIGGGGGVIGGQTYSGSATDLINYNVKFKNIDQSNSFTYATRMIEASDIFNNLENDITSMGKGEYIGQKALGKVPYGSALQSDVVRQQEQAERNFINATLRKESGATISPTEFDNAQKQYLPQPGDDTKTLEQKRKNRLTAIKGISAATGNQGALSKAINKVATKTSSKVEKPAPDKSFDAIRDSL